MSISPTPGKTRFFRVYIPAPEDPSSATLASPRRLCPSTPHSRICRSYLSTFIRYIICLFLQIWAHKYDSHKNTIFQKILKVNFLLGLFKYLKVEIRFIIDIVEEIKWWRFGISWNMIGYYLIFWLKCFYRPPAFPKSSLLLISVVLTVMKKYIIIFIFCSHFKKR